MSSTLRTKIWVIMLTSSSTIFSSALKNLLIWWHNWVLRRIQKSMIRLSLLKANTFESKRQKQYWKLLHMNTATIGFMVMIQATFKVETVVLKYFSNWEIRKIWRIMSWQRPKEKSARSKKRLRGYELRTKSFVLKSAKPWILNILSWMQNLKSSLSWSPRQVFWVIHSHSKFREIKFRSLKAPYLPGNFWRKCSKH